MKRTIAFIMALAMVLTLVPMTAFAAESITVERVDPDKKFYVGDAITTADFNVTYNDDSASFVVGSNYTVNGKSSVSFKRPGMQTLKIAYKAESGNTLEKSITVPVYSKEAIISASLSDAGKARTFVQGDTLTGDDFIVEYYKADASAPEKVLAASEITISPSKLANAGDNTITISYGTLKTTLTITGVIAKSDPKLIISGSGKTEYFVGDPFDDSGFTFFFQPRNSTSEDQRPATGVTNDAPAKFDTVGEKTITFTYTDGVDTVTETLKINVVSKLQSITFEWAEAPTFYAGDIFDPTGLRALVSERGTSEPKKHIFGNNADPSDFTWSSAPLKAGQTSIAITYTDDASGESITGNAEIVVLAKLAKLEYQGDVKTYYVGETFSPIGLNFLLYFTENTNVQGFYGTTEGAYSGLTWDKTKFEKAGTQSVKVSYTDAQTGEKVETTVTVVVKDPKEAKIQAATLAENLQVVVGDDFDPDKLFEVTFQAANTDGFNKLSYAAGDYKISPAPTSFTAAGTQSFTISKDDVSTTVSVEVLPVIKSMTVSGIASVDLYGGDAFDPNGISVEIVYNAGSLWKATDKTNRWPTGTRTADGVFTISEKYEENGLSWPSDKLLAGERTVTVTYTDAKTQAKASQDVTIEVKQLLKSLTVEGTKKFYADEAFNAEGLKIKVETNNGDAIEINSTDITAAATTITEEIEKALEYDRVTELKAGKGQSIVISYTHPESKETVSFTYKFDVEAPKYQLMKDTNGKIMGSEPKRLDYTEGELFDSTGLSWKLAKVRDGVADEANPITVTSGFQIYPDRELTPADTYVTVIYGNIAETYPITVKARTLVSIEVTQGPDLGSFYVGQRFDPEGMIVTATYNNKTTSEVSEFTYDSAAFTEADIGKKNITITYKEGDVTATTTYVAEIVAAPIRAASLVLSKSTVSIVETMTETLTATVYPAEATNKSLVWTSTNTAVARVDQAGKITAVGAGSCVITATTTDGSNRYADCYVVVDAKVDVKKLVLKADTMELLIDDSTTLTATIQPEDATYNVANWTTSNPDVVTVDADGKITGKKIGTATITASADGVEASIKISVVKELTKYGTVVNCSRRVNVRKSPDGGAKQVGYAYLGTTYVVTGEEGNWYRIQFNGDTAYIWKDYIELAKKSYTSDSEKTETDGSTDSSTSTTTPTIYTTLKVVNCKRYVYVRKGPSTGTSKVGHAKPGETYKLLGQSGSWYLIEYNGQQAYISSQFGQLS